jgi:hypothetical protein
MTNIKGFPTVPKAWQGLLWFGRFQHDKHQGLSNGTKKHGKGYCGLGKPNMTNIKGFPMVPKSMARAIVVWEIST